MKLRLIACAVALLATGCSLHAGRAPRFVVESLEPLPPFTTEAVAMGRDAGNSAFVGSELLWVFGDTFSGDELVCATAAWSDPDSPTELREPFDEARVPEQFYRFSPAELAFNAAHAEPPACCSEWRDCPDENLYCRCPAETDCSSRIALWPGDIIRTGPTTAINYYEKVQVGMAAFEFVHLGTGIARIEAGQTVARRRLDGSGEARTVFGPDEPNFLRALRVEEYDGPTIYVYAVTNRRGCYVDILVGRVPLAEAGTRSAYRFWDGVGWSRQLADAAPVLDGVVGGLGSVGWNEYLGAYVSGFTDMCTDGVGFRMRTAPRPEGPWSKPRVVDLSDVGASGEAYAGQLHTALDDGRHVVLSFYEPEVVGDDVIGRVHLVRASMVRSRLASRMRRVHR